MSPQANRTEKESNAARARQRPFGDRHGVVDYVPQYIQLEHTNRCNARCIMCNHFFLGNRGAGSLDPSVIALLEPVFPSVRQIMLNGDGEPFLYEHIRRALEIYHFHEIRIGSNTNLCAVPEDLFPVIGRTLSFLNVSCDGATAETFEMIRSGLSFDLFQTKMKALRARAPGVRVILDCVAMLQNVRELPALADRAAEWGCGAIKIHMLGVNPCIGNDADSLRHYPALTKACFQGLKKRCAEAGIAVSIPDIQTGASASRTEQTPAAPDGKLLHARREAAERAYGHLTLRTDYLSDEITPDLLETGSFPDRVSCRWPLERCYIDVNGNVSTCCYNTRWRMGNILQEGSFDAVWNGENYRSLRKLMQKGRLPEFCRACEYLKTEASAASAKG